MAQQAREDPLQIGRVYLDGARSPGGMSPRPAPAEPGHGGLYYDYGFPIPDLVYKRLGEWDEGGEG